jgi:uncharacterized protein (DUF2236 family)
MTDAGLFGPGSLTWRVHREGALLLGGGRALLLQVAHPLVAAGVSQHSTYRDDPFGRLFRTLDTVTTILFGSTPEAVAAAKRVRRVHTHVKGEDDDGTPYAATDPELIMWVHATLVDTSLLIYENYIGPLTVDERGRYYEEQQRLGEHYGIARTAQPATYADFAHYFDAMVYDGALHVTDTLRDVAAATMRPPLPVPVVGRPAVEYLNLVTTALLPAWLRDELGLPWGPARQRLHAVQRSMIRRLMPVLPSLLRELPPARRAERRARTASR